MYKIAIICQSLRNYAGAERVVYELTQAFIKEGHYVHLGCIDIGDFYHQQLTGVRVNDLVGGMDDEYDLIVCLHTHTLPYLFSQGVKCRKLCYFSLSPYEPIEAPLFSDDRFDVYLCNSAETRDELVRCGILVDRIYIFPNSCNFQNQSYELGDSLKKVAVVSNHPPKELLELSQLDSRIDFDYYGTAVKVEMLDGQCLSKYDAVITIGYTVVFAISAKVPVYMYDHFGGDGYLNSENYDKNSYFNFSGRPICNKKSADVILEELKSGFAPAIDAFPQVYASMLAERNISTHVNQLLKFDLHESKYVECSALQIKQAQAYSKLFLSNRYLQDIVNGSNESAISQNIISINNSLMHQSRLIEEIGNNVVNSQIYISKKTCADNLVIYKNINESINQNNDAINLQLNQCNEKIHSLYEYIRLIHERSIFNRLKKRMKAIFNRS